MMLSDVRDYVKSIRPSNPVYLGKLDIKQEQAIGVYHSKHSHPPKTAIGGSRLESYGIKYVTLLVHWNHSMRDTEKAARELFEALRQTREVTVNKEHVKFIQLLTDEPVDVGTDDDGIYEMVIEAAVVYAKGE